MPTLLNYGETYSIDKNERCYFLAFTFIINFIAKLHN